VHDPVVILTADGRELTSDHDLAVLGGPLHEILDTGSLDALQDAVAQAPTRNVELITYDGRVLDATVATEAEGAVVVLRDVSSYARAAEQLGSMAVSLARRNRDLRTLYEAAASLDATLDLAEIAHLTGELVGDYLDAQRVEVEVLGGTSVWPEGPDRRDADADPRGVFTLRTARGPLGELRWWRRSELLSNEAETLPLLLSRAAIGLDHALLLSSAEERAARDPLTGLYNRAGAQLALGRLVRPYAVALLDLDRFKEVNDLHGHAEGDRVLREVASILADGRGTDVKARWGGEEFLVALEHARRRPAGELGRGASGRGAAVGPGRRGAGGLLRGGGGGRRHRARPRPGRGGRRPLPREGTRSRPRRDGQRNRGDRAPRLVTVPVSRRCGGSVPTGDIHRRAGGGPDRIRTDDFCHARAALCQAELRARAGVWAPRWNAEGTRSSATVSDGPDGCGRPSPRSRAR
jgi:GGDEF domain-containing protein